MEIPILGWFILSKTNSVVLLAVFGGLQYIGTLLTPLFGVVGDRMGCRNLLCLLRGIFTLLSSLILIFAVADWLDPTLALIISGVGGILRPSDAMVRNTLVAQSVPEKSLMAAVGISRITQDIARIIGALTGTALVTFTGFVHAYAVIVLLYSIGTSLTFGALQIKHSSAARSPLQDMWHGLTYVWKVPALQSAFWIAFLFNLTAYPFTLGLLPYVAKEVYIIDQTGLGYLIASFSCGGLIGSISLSIWGHLVQSGRAMLLGCTFWYIFLAAFGQTTSLSAGIVLLCCAGFAQNICSVPMFVMMLKLSEQQYRGRVMGVRMLAIYGLPTGLMIAGPMINHMGFVYTNLIFVVTGMIFLATIGLIWRSHLIESAAPANQP